MNTADGQIDSGIYDATLVRDAPARRPTVMTEAAGTGPLLGEDRATRQTGYQRILTPSAGDRRRLMAVFPYLEHHCEVLLRAGVARGAP